MNPQNKETREQIETLQAKEGELGWEEENWCTEKIERHSV